MVKKPKRVKRKLYYPGLLKRFSDIIVNSSGDGELTLEIVCFIPPDAELPLFLERVCRQQEKNIGTHWVGIR